ncbi:MAG: chorismate mutase [Acidobacteriota bacterium]
MMRQSMEPPRSWCDAPEDPATILADCRQRIDRIDAVVVALLRERVLTAVEAARAKTALGEPLKAPARETAVLERLALLAADPLDGHAVARIFRAIIDETLAAEELLQSTAATGASEARRRAG